MLNKIYEGTKRYIKNNYKELIIYLIIFVVCTYKLDYYIYVGGGTIDLNNRIVLKSDEKGTYNLAYVKQLHATIPFYLLSKVIDKWDLESINTVSIDDSESASDIWDREKLYLEEANNNAILNAYKLANKEINIKESYYKVLHVDKDAKTDIKVGDILVSVDDNIIDSTLEYKKYLNTLEIGTDLNVKVKRNDKIINCKAKLMELEGTKVIGLYLVNVVDYDVNPEIKLNFKWNESGPSGGFMTSLAIYDRLVKEDLTKGRTIVGTGTIEEDGTVGEIGGVKYKLMGAVKKKADIFFVPKDNYKEAMKYKRKYNYKIKVVKVDTLNDAILYLQNN